MECCYMTLSQSRDVTRLVSNLQAGEYDGTDGGNRMKVEALEADLYEQCVQLKRLKELSLNSIFGNVGNGDYIDDK